MKIPYNQFELRGALFLIKDDELEEIAKKINELSASFGCDSKEELNKLTANRNGITVEQLISSPNYEILIEEQLQLSAEKFIADLGKKAGISNVSAWAVIAKAKSWI